MNKGENVAAISIRIHALFSIVLQGGVGEGNGGGGGRVVVVVVGLCYRDYSIFFLNFEHFWINAFMLFKVGMMEIFAFGMLVFCVCIKMRCLI